jgi:hypothetical protein
MIILDVTIMYSYYCSYNHVNQVRVILFHYLLLLLLLLLGLGLGFSSIGPKRNRAASLGDLSEQSSKRLLIDLISTLDDFFPDYDFHSTKPDQFLKKDVTHLIQLVNSYLAELTEEVPNFLEKLWSSIDDVINLRICDAFSLVPDMSEVCGSSKNNHHITLHHDCYFFV